MEKHLKLPIKWVVFPLLIAVVLVWIAALTSPDNRLHVFFLDVGQGDAILIQKGNQQILIDGGPSPEAITNELGEKLPFWEHTIELVVLTHPHDDHLAGLVEVLRRYEVKQVLESGIEYDSPTYDEWHRLIEEKGIKRTIAQAGQRIELEDGVRLDVLHPQTTLLQGTDDDVNNNCLVLRLAYGDVSFLFTADLEEEGERCLLEKGIELQSTVLKVGHQGSADSTSPNFLNAVQPQVAVISVGDNPYGHPHQEVLDRLNGTELFRTDKKGTIELITDGEQLGVNTD
jgi:competence protein ComEC